VSAAPRSEQQDIQALAKGGRTNVLGFALRLIGRIPFLFIAGRMYGAEALGRFAFALAIIELSAQLCTLGQKRGLAQELAREDAHPANVVGDAMLLSGALAAVLGVGFYLFPQPIFPSGEYSALDRLIPLALVPLTLTEIALSAQAYRFDVATSVRSRALVEPWVLSILAGLLWFVVPESGMILAYIGSVLAAAVVALLPVYRTYGLPRAWQPHPLRLGKLAIANLPLAVADVVEWGTRRLDLAILGIFASPATVGIYYVAQQIASLPQKFKSSFEPVLGPVITRNLKEKNYAAISKQVCQVGFWITAAQFGVALALGLPGRGVMGLTGPAFVAGTGALLALLAAEVIASAAVVSEAALIYVRRMLNMWISLATVAVQALASVGLIMAAQRLGLGEPFWAAGAAMGLLIALAFASLVKSVMLAAFLGQSTNPWRWSLLVAAAPAALVGWFFTRFMPEWAELAIGAPAILLTYLYVIWHKGFGPEDRMLFRRNVGT